MSSMATDRINIAETQEVMAWSRSLNTTPERLRDAVAAVGDKPELVLAHLSKLDRRGRVAWLPAADAGPDPRRQPLRRGERPR